MDYGTVQHNGKELTITEQPYPHTAVDNYIVSDCYQAIAEDDEGNEYMVRWDIIDSDAEDESDACDWEKYSVKAV